MKIINDYYGLNNMHFMDAEYVEGKLLFYDALSESFFVTDLENGQSKYVNIRNGDDINLDYPRRVVCSGSNVFFVQSSVCVIYHFKMMDEELLFVEKCQATDFKGKVKNAFIFEGKLWIIPMKSNEVMAVMDLESKTIEYRKMKTNFSSQNNYAIREVVFQAPYLYLSYAESSVLGRYNISEDSLVFFDTGIPEAIEGIASREENLILRSEGGQKIYSLNFDKKQYCLLAESKLESEKMGKVIALSNGTIIVCPILGNKFYYVDEEKRSIRRIKSQTEIRYKEGFTFTMGMREINGSLYIYPWAGEKLVEIHRNDNEWEVVERPFVMQVDNYREYLNNLNRKGKPIFEQEDISVEDFIHLI